MLLSKSRLAAFTQCPEKYRLGYLLGLRPLKDKPALVEGRCLHELVEVGLTRTGDLDAILAEASQDFWKATPLESLAYKDAAEYQATQVRCLAEAKLFLEQIGELEVLAAEIHLEQPAVDLESGAELPDLRLHGFVDLVVRDPDGEVRIVDIKTTSRKPQDLSGLSLDLSVYTYLHGYPGVFNGAVYPASLLYLVRTTKPQALWQHSTRGAKDFVDLMTLCQAVATNIQEQRFWRNPGMGCSWCDFAPLCLGDDKAAAGAFGAEALDAYKAGVPVKRLDQLNDNDLGE